MTWFSGTHTETRRLSVPAEVALARLASPAAIAAATRDVERAEIDGASVHLVVAEEDHGVVKYQADYTCTVVRDGDTVRWSTVPGGNCRRSGSAHVRDAEAGCTVELTETLEVDLGMPKLMAAAVRPVIARQIAAEIAAYLDRLLRPLG